MDRIIVEGGYPLSGKVRVQGAKNASLPILASTILCDGRSVIKNVPTLRDVTTLQSILKQLGISCERRSDGAIETEILSEEESTAPYELVSQMRASICVLGPLLAKRGYAKVSLPGGCVIGLRPIDLHLKGLRALGADIQVEHGYVVARAKRLRGNRIFLGGPFGSSVTGTANVMMAASLAEGKTVIEGAACEPEVVDLAHFLNRCGATIEGIGTPRLVITGVPELKGVTYEVCPDRIEAGTYVIAAAMAGSEVRVEGLALHHLGALFDILHQAGVRIQEKERAVKVHGCPKPEPLDVTTLPYPGFPTDLQAQLMAYLSLGNGISVITEKVYPDRFMHMAELNRLGAEIRKEGPSAIISGVDKLSGAPVMASDLRASAALVLAGLVAEGKTEVHRVYHIDRGYHRIEEKFANLGARVERVSD